jgi:hypothetical protein
VLRTAMTTAGHNAFDVAIHIECFFFFLSLYLMQGDMMSKDEITYPFGTTHDASTAV